MVTQGAETADIKEDIKKKPGPNNPEEATRFVQEVDKAVWKFADTVRSLQSASAEVAGHLASLATTAKSV